MNKKYIPYLLLGLSLSPALIHAADEPMKRGTIGQRPDAAIGRVVHTAIISQVNDAISPTYDKIHTSYKSHCNPGDSEFTLTINTTEQAAVSDTEYAKIVFTAKKMHGNVSFAGESNSPRFGNPLVSKKFELSETSSGTQWKLVTNAMKAYCNRSK